MLRRFFLLLFLLSTLCTPHALAEQTLADPRLAEETSHLALHVQKKAHHHHDDGSITVDGSDESVKHVATDGMPGAAVDFLSTDLLCHVVAACAPLQAEQRPKPEPFLARLKRPPKPAA